MATPLELKGTVLSKKILKVSSKGVLWTYGRTVPLQCRIPPGRLVGYWSGHLELYRHDVFDF
jgi:hypothetical protein